MASYTNLQVHRSDRMLTLTLDNPQRENSLTYESLKDLHQLLEEVNQDPSIDLVRFRSDSEAFSVGMDPVYMANLQEYGFKGNLVDSNHVAETLSSLLRCRKITVAEVGGKAEAEGALLALCCDFVFLSEEAQIGFPEVTRGSVPALAAVFLPYLLDTALSRRLLLTGELLSAAKADKLGVVYETASAADLRDYVQAFCQHVVRRTAGGAVEMTKRLLMDTRHMPLAESAGFATKMSAHARNTVEFRLGLKALLENETLDWNQTQ